MSNSPPPFTPLGRYGNPVWREPHSYYAELVRPVVAGGYEIASHSTGIRVYRQSLSVNWPGRTEVLVVPEGYSFEQALAFVLTTFMLERGESR